MAPKPPVASPIDDAWRWENRIEFARGYEQGVPITGWRAKLPRALRQYVLPKPKAVPPVMLADEVVSAAPASNAPLRATVPQDIDSTVNETAAAYNEDSPATARSTQPQPSLEDVLDNHDDTSVPKRHSIDPPSAEGGRSFIAGMMAYASGIFSARKKPVKRKQNNRLSFSILDHTVYRQTIRKHAHRLVKPERPEGITDDIVEAYYDLARTVGRFSLYGQGKEVIPVKETRLRSFDDTGDDADNRVIPLKADWGTKDKMLKPMPEEHRDLIIAHVLSEAARSGDVLNQKRFKISIDTPGALPEYVHEYSDMVAQEIVPEIASFVRRLPEPLRAHPDAFLNSDFYHHLVDVYRELISQNLIEEYGTDEHGNDYATLRPSLAYTLDRASDPAAPYLMGKRELIGRDLHKHWFIPRFYRRDNESFISRHKNSSGIGQRIMQFFGRKNPHLFSEEDVAEFGVLRKLYKETPQSIESILMSASAVYSFHEGTEYQETVLRILRNAHQLQVDTALKVDPSKNDSKAHAVSDRMHRMFMERVTDIDAEDGMTHKLDDASHAILRMFKTHAIAAEKYKSTFSAILTSKRTPVIRRQGEHIDHRTEGPLVRYGTYFEGTERILNGPKESGFFFHLADTQHENFHDYVKKFNAVGITSILGISSPQRIDKFRGWLASGGHADAAVRPNTLGRAYTIAGTELLLWGMKRGLHNLRDNAPFWSPLKAFNQVVRQAITDPRALLEDAFNDSEIPDNPGKVSLDIPDTIDESFRFMRPAYLHQPSRRVHTILGAIPIINAFNFTPSAGTVEQYHARILDRDFVADEDNIPTLAAIGMLNVRRNDIKEARKYLGMTINWAKTAKKKGLPASDWDALANYEMSIMYGVKGAEEDREKHLVGAFDAFAQHSQLEVAPYSSGTADLAKYCLLHPMNYGRRLELLRKLDNGYSGSEISVAAHHAASEIETILRIKETAELGGRRLDDRVRERMVKLRNGFNDLIIDVGYKVTGDEPQQGGTMMPERKDEGLESKVLSAAPAASTRVLHDEMAGSAAKTTAGYVDPKYRISNDPLLSDAARQYLAGLEKPIYENLKK